MEYALEIQTVPGIADSEYLDRLADIVYDLDGLIDPLLGLNDDGSISASFCVVGANPLQAAHDAVAAFVQSCAAAAPLRGPTADEIEHGLKTAAELGAATAATVEKFAVAVAGDREHAYA